MPSLETTFCGLRLPSPFVNGSGTLDALVSGTLGWTKVRSSFRQQGACLGFDFFLIVAPY